MYKLASSILLIVLVGCGQELRVDISSEDNYTESLEAIKKSLPENKKLAYEQAFSAIASNELKNISLTPEKMTSDEMLTLQKNLRYTLNGLSADEIINSGNKIISADKEREKKHKAAELVETKSLIEDHKQRQQDSKTAVDVLKKLNIVDSRFFFLNDFKPQIPVIQLTASNETKYDISRIYFIGKLTSPDRSTPWIEQLFIFSINGVLEPGAQATWQLSNVMEGLWRKVPTDRKDMTLSVNVTRIDGIGGKPIAVSNFSSTDKYRLANLNSRLLELEKHKK